MSSTEARQPIGDSVVYAIDGCLPIANEILRAIAESMMRLQHFGDRHFKVGVYLYNIPEQWVEIVPLCRPEIQQLRQLLESCRQTVRPLESCSASLLLLTQKLKESFRNSHDDSFIRLVIFAKHNTNFPQAFVPELQREFSAIVNLGVLIVPALFDTPMAHTPSAVSAAAAAARLWPELSYMPANMTTAALNSGLHVSLKPISYSTLPSHMIPLVLEQLVRQKAERKPVLFRGVLSLKALKIGVCGYKILSPRRKRGFYTRSSNSGPNADVATGDELDNPTTSRDMVVNEPNMRALRNYNASHNTLIIQRFIPNDQCEVHMHMHLYASIFIVASNRDLKKSKDAFAALHRSMSCKRLVALAIFTPQQSNRAPMHGLLFAHDTSTGKYDGPSTRQGMYFVRLPFTHDLRDLSMAPLDVHTNQSDRLDRSMAVLVRRLYNPRGYTPILYQNPASEQCFRVMNYAALGELYCDLMTLKEEPTDNTRPDYAAFKARVGNLCERINRYLDKRSNGQKSSFPNNSKRQKEENTLPEMQSDLR